MEVYIFSRDKYIEERVAWFCEYKEKFDEILQGQGEKRAEALFGRVWYSHLAEMFKMSKEEYEAHIQGVEWAIKYDGEIVDFDDNDDDYGYIYNYGIGIKWCEIKEVDNYDHNFKTTKNLYCLHDFMKEISLEQRAINKDDLMAALRKFGKVEYNEHNDEYILHNSYYGKDNIHLIDLENNMCYITALGSWDGRAGGMYFDYREQYAKLIDKDE